MLNEEKIKLMTRMAIYENDIGKEDIKINEYKKHDYILLNNIKTRIGVTISCLMIFGVHFVYLFMKILMNNSKIDLYELGVRYIMIYSFIMIVYTFISSRIYSKKYKFAQARLGGYLKMLEKLNKYDNE